MPRNSWLSPAAGSRRGSVLHRLGAEHVVLIPAPSVVKAIHTAPPGRQSWLYGECERVAFEQERHHRHGNGSCRNRTIHEDMRQQNSAGRIAFAKRAADEPERRLHALKDFGRRHIGVKRYGRVRASLGQLDDEVVSTWSPESKSVPSAVSFAASFSRCLVCHNGGRLLLALRGFALRRLRQPPRPHIVCGHARSPCRLKPRVPKHLAEVPEFRVVTKPLRKPWERSHNPCSKGISRSPECPCSSPTLMSRISACACWK